MNIKVGQTWRTRGLGNVHVLGKSGAHFTVGTGGLSYTVDDQGRVILLSSSGGDLVARVPRIYIAGPMTGHPEFNFPAFHARASELRERGLHVENPAEINPDTTMSWVDCMRLDIERLLTCDTIAMLPGWEKSRGASLEHHIAQSLGMTVIHSEE